MDAGIKLCAKTGFPQTAKEACERPVDTYIGLEAPVKRDSFVHPAPRISTLHSIPKMPEVVNLKEKRFGGSSPRSVGPKALDSWKGPMSGQDPRAE